MKKILAITFSIFLLFGNTPIHASHRVAKGWAYTKIGLGWGAGILELISFVQALANLNSSAINTPGTTYNDGYNDGYNNALRRQELSQIIFKIPLGILLVKHGRRDLRRISKQEAKEAAQT